VRLVIADTGPINYLLQISHIDILPVLSEKVMLPSPVKEELMDPEAPALVRAWVANRQSGLMSTKWTAPASLLTSGGERRRRSLLRSNCTLTCC
jgi:hypothetical protein